MKWLICISASRQPCPQAAARIADAASAHAGDEEYDSPYMQLARQQGLDLPWWQKVRTASFNDGKFAMGGLKVRAGLLQRLGFWLQCLLHVAASAESGSIL